MTKSIGRRNNLMKDEKERFLNDKTVRNDEMIEIAALPEVARNDCGFLSLRGRNDRSNLNNKRKSKIASLDRKYILRYP